MKRVKSIYMSDLQLKGEWSNNADIDVPGLGEVTIKDCLSQETIDKVCEEVLFALEQKMKGRS